MSNIILINIHAQEWVDRENGNSYFSCQVTVIRPETKAKYFMPFQYGYEEHYLHSAFALLKLKGEVPQDAYLYQYKINAIKEQKRLKRDVKAWGAELTKI